ncbi:alaserpin-like [Pseudomyrmex gracilis]|uniref:alaserpin-like n=1 Tax=Pseudomyrmex gracilis TaxID=219809 RepID=UPI000995B9F7|nr:alaserpin-like [Pseudomyrmex gracilis]
MSLTNPTVYILVLYLLVGTEPFLRVVRSQTLENKPPYVDKNPIENVEKMISSCHEFTSLLYKTLSKSIKGNIVISPVNLYLLFSLLTHGTGDSTLDELKCILFDDDNDTISSTEELADWIAQIKDLKHGDLYSANAIFAQHRCPFNDTFVSICTNNFDSTITTVDFSNKIKAVEVINSWIQRSTYIKILSKLNPDIIDQETRMMLVNTMYFKGNWYDTFDRNIQMRQFYVSKRHSPFVPTMKKTTKFNYSEIPEWKASLIEIPYMNSDFVMVILLPNEEVDLQTVERNFNWTSLANAPRSVEEIELYLPKFNIDFTVDLKDTLKELSVITMFSEDAKFSTMISQPMHLNHIIEKTVIDIESPDDDVLVADEEGSRNLASRIFAVERPFLFAIEYKPHKVPLLLGSVRELKHQLWNDEF